MWTSLANIFLTERKYKGAEFCLKNLESIQNDRKLFLTHIKLANLYLELKEYKLGIKHIALANNINNQSAISCYLEGRLLWELGNKKQAINLLLKSLTLDNYMPLVNLQLYKIDYENENWQSAENDLWYERDRLPECGYIYYLLAIFALESNAPQAALPIIQKAIRFEPNRKEYWNGLQEIQNALRPVKRKKK